MAANVEWAGFACPRVTTMKSACKNQVVTQTIHDVLNRRSDLSTFVVHFTRNSDAGSARVNLRSVIRARRIEARTPFGWARDHAESTGGHVRQSQLCVCFSEAPLEHLYSLVADIANRSVKLCPYGLAVTKMVARRNGANPVWYVDMTPGRDWEQARSLDDLRAQAIAGDFTSDPSTSLFPYFEPMGTWGGRQREFWWEREWRKVGNYRLEEHEIAFWLCPEDEIDDFEAFIATEWDLGDLAPNARLRFGQRFVDPRWSVEGIIACLVGKEGTTPFAPR